MNKLKNDEARVNVTYNRQNGDLLDSVHVHSCDSDLRAWVSEAIVSGSIPGIDATRANFSGHIVDRFNANDTRPYNLIQIRPKTPFG